VAQLRKNGWMVRGLLIAAAFSLFYASMYPILTGGFVIYVYPYWSPRATVTWIVGGILVQAWFCLLSTPRGPRAGPVMTLSRSTLPTQVGAGVLYAASIILLSGGCYQS
jgi:hypothetical protein